MPPERNAPSGTSAIMRRRTESRRSASSASTASPASSFGACRAARPRPRSASSVRSSARRRRAIVRIAPGGKLVDVAEHGRGRGHIAVAQRPPRSRRGSTSRRNDGMRHQRAQFRAEQQRAVLNGPVERLHADAVAHQMQHALAPVEHREGEHADEALRPRPSTPHCMKAASITSVSEVPRKEWPSAGELRAQVLEVVDLAVVGDDEAAVGGMHRLRAGRR